jgi:hypothetical protein
MMITEQSASIIDKELYPGHRSIDVAGFSGIGAEWVLYRKYVSEATESHIIVTEVYMKRDEG